MNFWYFLAGVATGVVTLFLGFIMGFAVAQIKKPE